MIQIPALVPAIGLYYHYKHNPEKGIQDYAYEVIGVGVHTEDDCRHEDAHMVIYRPLYEAAVFKAGKLFDLRPLQMWMGNVTVHEKTVARFQRITDPDTIEKLIEIRTRMYGIPS